MILAAVLVFICLFLLFLYSQMRISSRENKELERLHEKWVTRYLHNKRNKNDDMFCLAALKRVSMVDFSRAPSCSIQKCHRCPMSVPVDL